MSRTVSTLALLVLVRCAPEPSQDARVCDVFKGDRIADVTAGNQTSAPDVSDGQVRYDVTLVDGVAGNGGLVAYASAHALPHFVYLSEDMPLKVLNPVGEEISWTRAEPVGPGTLADCSSVRRKYVVPLESETTYHFGFYRTALETVQIVVAPEQPGTPD